MDDKKKGNEESKIQHMPLGMCIGISVGVAIGSALDNIPVFMCLGLGIGMCIGSVIDMQNKKKDDYNSDEDKNEE